eukprot:12138622-Prorocentrum_lima.AAC.1
MESTCVVSISRRGLCGGIVRVALVCVCVCVCKLQCLDIGVTSVVPLQDNAKQLVFRLRDSSLDVVNARGDHADH